MGHVIYVMIVIGGLGKEVIDGVDLIIGYKP